MAARLPINPLPFESDTEQHNFEVGSTEHGEPIIERMTKRQYFDRIMADWHVKASALAAAKLAEDYARAKITELMYPDSWDEDGTDKFELPGGWVLEMERRINVKVDAEALPAVRKIVSELPVDEETGEMPTLEAAIKMKPDFSMSGFRNLRDDVKVAVRECCTFTPGTPGVKLNAPKQKAEKRIDDQKARGSKTL
jgi:hypothetical protein